MFGGVLLGRSGPELGCRTERRRSKCVDLVSACMYSVVLYVWYDVGDDNGCERGGR